MSSKTASSMRWHTDGRKKDGKLRHPADDFGSLSKYPSLWMKTFSKVTCNGFKFRIKKVDKNSLTQNCGVVVSATSREGDISYYGVLTEILELDYYGGRTVLLFRCDWVDPNKGVKEDQFGFTLVNLKALWKTDEPFVLASQALQVFHTPDPKDKN